MTLRPEILLHPNIPKPMHGIAPRTILGQGWWDIERRKAYANAQYRCQACGIHKTEAKYHQWLEAHELYEFDYANGKMIFTEIVALCHSCHNYIHSGRMQSLVDGSDIEMTNVKMLDILRHGDKLVKEAKLKQPEPPRKVAAWGKWRLVLFGKEYKGKFKNYADWRKTYF